MVDCTNCGKPVDPSKDQFCPACGVPIEGGKADLERKEAMKAMMKSSVTWAGIFLFIAAIPSFILGIYAIMNDMSVAEYYIDLWKSLGDAVNISVEDLANIVRDIGILGLVIGMLGMFASILCFIRKMWWIVLTIAIVTLIFGFMTFIGIFLGIFALWTVILSRKVFDGPLS